MSMTQSHIFLSVPISGPPPTPALLKMMCAVPKAFTASSRRRFTSSALRTSMFTPMTFTLLPLNSATTSSSGPCSMSPSTRFTPAFANCFAVASPRPLAPPVMTAVFPCSSMIPPSYLNKFQFLTIDPGWTLLRYRLRQSSKCLGNVAIWVTDHHWKPSVATVS